MELVFAVTKVRAMERELLSRDLQAMLGQDRAAILAGLKARGLISGGEKDTFELEASINLATFKRAVYILELCPSPAREFLLEYYLPWRADFCALSAALSSFGEEAPEAMKGGQVYTRLRGLEEAKSLSEFLELNLYGLGDVFYELARQKAPLPELKDIAYALLGKRLIARVGGELDPNLLGAWRLISKEMDLADISFIARCKSAGREVQLPLLLGAGGLVSRGDMAWLAKSPDHDSFLKRLHLVAALDPARTGTALREMYERAVAGDGIGVALGFANLSLMDAAVARGLLLGKTYGIDAEAIEEVCAA